MRIITVEEHFFMPGVGDFLAARSVDSHPSTMRSQSAPVTGAQAGQPQEKDRSLVGK
jgi:transketolase C-terminal domain/subunit